MKAYHPNREYHHVICDHNHVIIPGNIYHWKACETTKDRTIADIREILSHHQTIKNLD